MFPPRIFIICILPIISINSQQVKPFVHHELHQTHHQAHHQYHRPTRQYAPQAPHPQRYVGQQQHYATHGQAQHVVEPHGPGLVKLVENNKCHLDYVELTEDVCIPTFKTDCDKEEVAGGVVIKHRDDCHDVTKTVCTELHDIEDMEVCAYAFTMLVVEAEAKLVNAEWKENCHEIKECVPAPPTHGYGAPTCNEVIRRECHQEPALVPVTKPISVKLPQPDETCIIKQVLLPRVECQQVRERRCMMSPQALPGPKIKIDKCSVLVDDPQCNEVILQLPRQKCPSKIIRQY